MFINEEHYNNMDCFNVLIDEIRLHFYSAKSGKPTCSFLYFSFC